jgi:hypothetical protein
LDTDGSLSAEHGEAVGLRFADMMVLDKLVEAESLDAEDDFERAIGKLAEAYEVYDSASTNPESGSVSEPVRIKLFAPVKAIRPRMEAMHPGTSTYI